MEGGGESFWQAVSLEQDGSCLLIKPNFVERLLTYKLQVFDGCHFWHESVTKIEFKKKCKELNPNIEARPDYVFNEIKIKCDNLPQRECLTINKDHGGNALKIHLKFRLSKEVPFLWRFDLEKVSDYSFLAQNILLPLFSMMGEFNKRQAELFSVIEKKDLEIQDLKEQGAVSSRRKLETGVFDAPAFLEQRLESEKFLEVTKNPIKAFAEKDCQKLFAQVILTRKIDETDAHDRAAIRETYTNEIVDDTPTQTKSPMEEQDHSHQASGSPINLHHFTSEYTTRREIIERKLAEKASGTRNKPKRKKINL